MQFRHTFHDIYCRIRITKQIAVQCSRYAMIWKLSIRYLVFAEYGSDRDGTLVGRVGSAFLFWHWLHVCKLPRSGYYLSLKCKQGDTSVRTGNNTGAHLRRTIAGISTLRFCYSLKRKEHLERHKLGHNPDRPYVCSVCRKGFKRREHLNLHTVIHSGVKTELCGECGKGSI